LLISDDFGKSWSSVKEFPDNVAVAIYPTSAKVIFASYFASPDTVSLFRSTDRGTSWSEVGRELNPDYPNNFFMKDINDTIFIIYWNRKDNAYQELRRSIDLGKTWSHNLIAYSSRISKDIYRISNGYILNVNYKAFYFNNDFSTIIPLSNIGITSNQKALLYVSGD
jgi:hypothetical protein